MAGVLVDGGESIALQYLTNKESTTENLVMDLFVNDVTPADTDVVGTYTKATFSGYAAATLTGASWTVSGTSPTTVSFAQQTFTADATISPAQTVYGMILTRATTGDLIAAERFASQTVIASSGDAVSATPNITMT